MGLFVSYCPHCNANIDWFGIAPTNYVCDCGKPVSALEIKTSFDTEYAKNIKSVCDKELAKFPNLSLTELAKKLKLRFEYVESLYRS